MNKPHRFASSPFPWIVVGFVAASALAAPRHACAAEPHKYGNSLDWVPESASFYSALLRNKEQIDNIANSKAWAKFTDLSTVRQSWQTMQVLMALPGGPISTIQQALQQPENQQLLDMVGDLLSNEVFYYGDVQGIEWMQLVSRAMNMSQFESMIGGGESGPEAQQFEQVREMFRLLCANDKLQTPTLVVGFRHSNAERATAQLARLEKLIGEAVESAPPLKGRFSRRKLGSAEYLVLNLDGQMVPWSEIPLNQLELKPGEFDKAIDKLKRLKLSIALGVRGDYVLLAIGPTSDHLAGLGTGKLLAERSDFEPLAKYADKRITGIHYRSKEARLAERADESSLGGFADVLRGKLSGSRLSKELQKQLDTKLASAAKSLQAAANRLGPTLSVSYLTPVGYESYSYDWSGFDEAAASKRLDLTEHVGGTPLVALVGRARMSGADYGDFVDFVKLAHGFFEELAIQPLPAADQAHYRDFMETVKPLLARLNTATEKMLLPGLADGQFGFVLDAKLTSQQWFKGMPRAAAPLPMLEPAVVVGVSDPELVKKAFSEYRAVADAVIAKLKEKDPESLPPDFKIPDPQVRDSKNGTIYSYPFSKDLGLDPQLALNAGLGKRVAVLSVAPKHTGELLASTPFEAEGPAGDAKRPLVSVEYLDWASVVEAVTPWLDYAVAQYYAARADAGVQQDGGPRATLTELHGFLDVLKVFRTVSSATYAEGKAMVTHTETHFQDLK